MKIFISHSAKELPLALEMRKRLRRAGFNPWLADKDAPLGEPYSKAISKALKDSQATVLLLSKESAKSEHVLREVSLSKRVLIIEVERCSPSGSLNYFIHLLPKISITEGWREIVRRIGASL